MTLLRIELLLKKSDRAQRDWVMGRRRRVTESLWGQCLDIKSDLKVSFIRLNGRSLTNKYASGNKNTKSHFKIRFLGIIFEYTWLKLCDWVWQVTKFICVCVCVKMLENPSLCGTHPTGREKSWTRPESTQNGRLELHLPLLLTHKVGSSALSAEEKPLFC